MRQLAAFENTIFVPRYLWPPGRKTDTEHRAAWTSIDASAEIPSVVLEDYANEAVLPSADFLSLDGDLARIEHVNGPKGVWYL